MRESATVTHVYCDVCDKKISGVLPTIEVCSRYLMADKVASIEVKLSYVSPLGVSTDICHDCAKLALEEALIKLARGKVG